MAEPCNNEDRSPELNEGPKQDAQVDNERKIIRPDDDVAGADHPPTAAAIREIKQQTD